MSRCKACDKPLEFMNLRDEDELCNTCLAAICCDEDPFEQWEQDALLETILLDGSIPIDLTYLDVES